LAAFKTRQQEHVGSIISIWAMAMHLVWVIKTCRRLNLPSETINTGDVSWMNGNVCSTK